jgi:hypothetical protein
MPAHALGLLNPWASGRTRSARLTAILDRYDAVADHRPELSLQEWGVVVQVLGALATMRVSASRHCLAGDQRPSMQAIQIVPGRRQR